MAKMLMITAELENMTNLQPQRGPDDPDFPYYFKMKCMQCGEVSKKESCVMLSEKLDMGRYDTNLFQRCKFCNRGGIVTLIPGRGRPLTAEASQAGRYTPLMIFECKGLEPVDFSFGRGWYAESTSGTKFEHIDLTGGEYDDYCEEGEVPVMISNLKAKLEPVKGYVYTDIYGQRIM